MVLESFFKKLILERFIGHFVSPSLLTDHPLISRARTFCYMLNFFLQASRFCGIELRLKPISNMVLESFFKKLILTFYWTFCFTPLLTTN